MALKGRDGRRFSQTPQPMHRSGPSNINRMRTFRLAQTAADAVIRLPKFRNAAVLSGCDSSDSTFSLRENRTSADGVKAQFLSLFPTFLCSNAGKCRNNSHRAPAHNPGGIHLLLVDFIFQFRDCVFLRNSRPVHATVTQKGNFVARFGGRSDTSFCPSERPFFQTAVRSGGSRKVLSFAPCNERRESERPGSQNVQEMPIYEFLYKDAFDFLTIFVTVFTVRFVPF